MDEILLSECVGFEWDNGNYNKSWDKHDVTPSECEQVFFNEPLLIFQDSKHSHSENRIYILGQTDESRNLFIALTIRNHLIRVISARDMSRKERETYAQA